MNIIVCIKQVPGTNEVKMNKETNTIIREGVEAIINPFDLYAVEEGIRLKEKAGGKITVMSMGIPTVTELLRETIALGADDAVLVSDRAFAGADTLATAYTLSMGIRKLGAFDIILCGKQAIDGDTAQVGPSLAEKLGIPHVTYVKKIEAIQDGIVRVQRMTEEGYEVIQVTLPAVLTVLKEINEPRLPSIKNKMRAKKAEIPVWNAEAIGADTRLTGLNGSPTKVIRTFVPELNITGELLKGTPEEMSKALVEKLLNFELRKSS